MGQLCHEFKRMRGQLKENNWQIWNMIEGEWALRVAITHDILSPLSVLKGYQEISMDYIALYKAENLLFLRWGEDFRLLWHCHTQRFVVSHDETRRFIFYL